MNSIKKAPLIKLEEWIWLTLLGWIPGVLLGLFVLVFCTTLLAVARGH